MSTHDRAADLAGGSLVVISFYKFSNFTHYMDTQKPLKDLCVKERVSGFIILAPEGINGSICGTRESIDRVLRYIEASPGLDGLRLIESPVNHEEDVLFHEHDRRHFLVGTHGAPFRWDHVRVRVKKEIVTLGVPAVSPVNRVGEYVQPKAWNALISDPTTIVIDVRNCYETCIGRFKGAIDPCTSAFREFPSWIDDHFTQADSDWGRGGDGLVRLPRCDPVVPRRIAMYCTGGIRCEKASSFLLSRGFKEVYHLEGGILRYLEEVPRTMSLWEGECFVFDKRVSVGHGLVQGNLKLCYGCKSPVSDKDTESPQWEEGVSCPVCFSSKSKREKGRARDRQGQFTRWGTTGGPAKSK